MQVLFYMLPEALENISSSMGVTANARIMHKLKNTGKLSGMAQIADYQNLGRLYTTPLYDQIPSGNLLL